MMKQPVIDARSLTKVYQLGEVAVQALRACHCRYFLAR